MVVSQFKMSKLSCKIALSVLLAVPANLLASDSPVEEDQSQITFHESDSLLVSIGSVADPRGLARTAAMSGDVTVTRSTTHVDGTQELIYTINEDGEASLVSSESYIPDSDQDDEATDPAFTGCGAYYPPDIDCN